MKPNQLILDIECYQNYLLVLFRNAHGKHKYFEMFNDSELDKDGIRKLLDTFEIITFNGNGYDMVILAFALNGSTNQQLKNLSDKIIVEGEKSWNLYRTFKVPEIVCNHVDIIEPAPAVKISLKLYGGRLHTRLLQDLPIEPHEVIDEQKRATLIEYCKNDVTVTQDLLEAIDERISIRRAMSDEYGIDLRSKSDAQIAETVIKYQVEQTTGIKVKKPSVKRQVFKYQKPDFIKFETEQLQNTLNFFENVEFIVEKNGVISIAQEPELVVIGDTTFKLGMGGLHSQEAETYHVADDNNRIVDIDAAAFYPNTILKLGLYPEALGEGFISSFKAIVDRRLEAKRTKDKLMDSSAKIMINGTFGKLGSIYSVLFAPHLLIQTTVTGQLVLLMLIERLNKYGIPVVSGNTDGIVVKCPRELFETHLQTIVKAWEKFTGYNMEYTEYSAIYSRDVNSYISIKTDGKVKTKGFFAEGGIQKSPTNDICAKAFVKYLKDGTPFEETIRNCTDIREFVSIRTVKGGAVKDNQYLGKAIRWYMSTEASGAIHYKLTGNMVPRTTGAKPCMNLPDELPTDINYDWYIKECNDMLYDVGLKVRPVPIKLPRKNTKLWKQMLNDGIIIEIDDGIYRHIDDLKEI